MNEIYWNVKYLKIAILKLASHIIAATSPPIHPNTDCFACRQNSSVSKGKMLWWQYSHKIWSNYLDSYQRLNHEHFQASFDKKYRNKDKLLSTDNWMYPFGPNSFIMLKHKLYLPWWWSSEQFIPQTLNYSKANWLTHFRPGSWFSTINQVVDFYKENVRKTLVKDGLKCNSSTGVFQTFC